MLNWSCNRLEWAPLDCPLWKLRWSMVGKPFKVNKHGISNQMKAEGLHGQNQHESTKWIQMEKSMPYMEHLGVQWCTHISANLLEFFQIWVPLKSRECLSCPFIFSYHAPWWLVKELSTWPPWPSLIPLSSESCCLGESFRQHLLYGTYCFMDVYGT